MFLRGRVRPEDCTRNEDKHRDRVHAHPKEGCPDRRPDIQRGRGHAHTGQGFAEACIRCCEPVQTEIGPACGEASEGGWRVDCHGDGRLRQGGSQNQIGAGEPGRPGRSRSAIWDTIRRQLVSTLFIHRKTLKTIPRHNLLIDFISLSPRADRSHPRRRFAGSVIHGCSVIAKKDHSHPHQDGTQSLPSSPGGD